MVGFGPFVETSKGRMAICGGTGQLFVGHAFSLQVSGVGKQGERVIPGDALDTWLVGI